MDCTGGVGSIVKVTLTLSFAVAAALEVTGTVAV